MTMNRDEITALLAMATALDRRTTGDSDITAWQGIANDEHWTLPWAAKALREHYGRNREWLMPSDITKRINEVRTRIRRTLDHDLYRAPADLADDPRAEIAWVKNRLADHVTAALDAWAATGQIAETPAAAMAIAHHVTERLALTAAPGASDAAA